MRAVRLHSFSGLEGLRIDELPGPVPGPGEVAVRVRATSLNYRDLLITTGQYNPRAPLPLVVLSDGAGEVAEVGPGTRRFRVGDRVAAACLSGWQSGPPTAAAARTALGGGGTGLLAERVVLPENGLVAIPGHLSFEEAATLPCAGVTAWHALVAEGGVQPGHTVLIQGSGGVSVFALQFARLAGARVIATSSSDAKLERLQRLGASHGINYRSTPEWDRAVLDLTGGEGVDHVVEVGGGATLPLSLRSVKPGGRVDLIGVLSGREAPPLSLLPILMRNVRVQGVFIGSVSMFEAMNRAVAFHQLRPVIDQVFPLEAVADALRRLERGEHFGKVVVRV